jgi:hypothetical protein
MRPLRQHRTGYSDEANLALIFVYINANIVHTLVSSGYDSDGVIH